MLKAHERWVLHYLVHLEPVPAEGPVDISMRSAIDHLKSLADARNAKADVNGVVLRVAKVEVDGNWAKILFLNFDPSGAVPTFGSAETGEIRVSDRQDGESNTYSAHAVIRLSPEGNTSAGYPQYRMTLEDVPGLGKTRLLPLINKLLRTNTRSFTDRQGVEGRSFHPKLSVWPYFEASVKQEIQDGVLRHFELVRRAPRRGALDERRGVKEISRSVKFRPVFSDGYTLEAALDGLRRLASRAKYDQVKIVYRGPKGNQLSASFNPSRQDFEDVLQSKYVHVHLRSPMRNATTEIAEELSEAMKLQMIPTPPTP